MIFKIHYGLWYGGLVGIIPFTFNYAVKYCGATATQHGILFTVLPFVALIAKPIVCSLADKYAAHRRALLACILLTILGYGSLAIYPFVPDLGQNNKRLTWILYCLGVFVGNTSMCVVNSLGDSLAINSCTRKNINYGQYRLWGPVGFGLFGIVWGLFNGTSFLPDYTPGIITMVAILATNALLLAFWTDHDEFKIQSTVPVAPSGYSTDSSLIGQASNTNEPAGPQQGATRPERAQDQETVGSVDGGAGAGEQPGPSAADISKRVERLRWLWRLGCEQKSIFAYLFIFTFCGLLTGIHWQFFFQFLAMIAKQTNQDFSTLALLVLPVQALGGELIFFVLSGKILNCLGAPMTLSICLLSFAARYLLYAYLVPLVNIYWILPIELLQGPAFGLMYCVLTHQANVYSEKIDDMIESHRSMSNDVTLKRSLHATLQGLLGASFEGLGLGLGSLIGGMAFDATPTLMWQIAGFSSLLVALVYLVGRLVTRKQTAGSRAHQTLEG